MSIVEVPETERTRHLETLPQEQGLNAPHGERSHSLEPGNHSARALDEPIVVFQFLNSSVVRWLGRQGQEGAACFG